MTRSSIFGNAATSRRTVPGVAKSNHACRNAPYYGEARSYETASANSHIWQDYNINADLRRYPDFRAGQDLCRPFVCRRRCYSCSYITWRWTGQVRAPVTTSVCASRSAGISRSDCCCDPIPATSQLPSEHGRKQSGSPWCSIDHLPQVSCPDGATGLTRRPIPAAVDHADPHPALWIIHYDVR